VTSAYDLSELSGSAAPPAPAPFTFSGRGGEYFRIWIVNLLLSIVTLGIYSAWAKVRRTRYFYDNTSVAGSSFEYHGNPIAILKGRIAAVVLVALHHFAPRIAPMFGVAVFVLFTVATPWLIWKSLQFKLYNSSYRGIRFGLRGSAREAYIVFLLWPLLTGLTLFLLAPFAHQRMKRFQHNSSRFGDASFSFHATVGSFYKTYLIGLAIALAGIIAIGMLFGGSAAALAGLSRRSPAAILSAMTFFFALYLWMAVLYPLFYTLIQNLIWNNTRLGAHGIQSRMKWSRMTWIWLSNLFLIAVTLGLFMPFATIRLLRYRIESMSLLPAGDLNEFTAAAEPPGSVTGEGLSDLLDFDISL
jgi:uncharacterized membrane protein YjgN (DUF898 family)